MSIFISAYNETIAQQQIARIDYKPNTLCFDIYNFGNMTCILLRQFCGNEEDRGQHKKNKRFCYPVQYSSSTQASWQKTKETLSIIFAFTPSPSASRQKPSPIKRKPESSTSRRRPPPQIQHWSEEVKSSLS